MLGMDANTGKQLSGIAHLAQSLHIILSTPIGSRVMRREFGSQLFALTDAPLNRSTVMDVYGATAEAVGRWEPRLALQQVKMSNPTPGAMTVDLSGVYLPTGETITLNSVGVN